MLTLFSLGATSAIEQKVEVQNHQDPFPIDSPPKGSRQRKTLGALPGLAPAQESSGTTSVHGIEITRQFRKGYQIDMFPS